MRRTVPSVVPVVVLAVVLSVVAMASVAACVPASGRDGSAGSSPVPAGDGSAGAGDELLPDRFCAAWDAYGVTLLALAATPDLAEAARREVLAAAALVSAIESIGAEWPQALVGERSLVLTDVVGPYLRRAQKALVALADAGATDDDVRQLALAWREALATRPTDGAGPLEWVGAVTVPAALRPTVESAARLLVTRVPAFADDPTLPGRRSLVGPLDTPRTDEYLAANCPDVGDVVAAMQF